MRIVRPAKDDGYFVRMTLQERLQHGLLIVSFFLLVLTGLPLIAYEWKPLQALFFFKFSFYLRGVIHRIAAVMLIFVCVWHAIYAIFTPRGRETIKTLVFRKKDCTDAFETLMHNLGFTSWLYRRGKFRGFFERHPYLLFKEAPRYGRYSFIEKFEYLAVVWGSVVMILTGFFMWRVELAMQLIPKYVFDVFVAIHGYEAILAFLAVIIWHMYNVHLSPPVFPMSRVWLTGKISRKELMEKHPLEYEELRRKLCDGEPR
jgi:cytochrome b subunit of formate dehydrogenase